MPEITVSAPTSASAEQAWAVLSDISRQPEWLTLHDAFSGEPPAAATEGAAYKQRIKVMGFPAEVAWTVVTAKAPAQLELAGDGPMGIKVRAGFGVEPTDSGSTLSMRLAFEGGALMGPMASTVEAQAKTAAEQSLAKLTALLG